MAARSGGIGPAFVGRSRELDVVGALVQRAVDGESGGLLVFGDAGVGKTALVQQACSNADPDALVLVGACLRLTSMTVPFLAIRSALRAAPRDVVSLPQLPPGDTPANVPVAFDAWIDDLCRERPVVLVIDDLHWADRSTLDVLMYLLAGPAQRRLALIVTARAGELGDDNVLQRWLADIRRLPRVEELALEPLDRVETGDQIAQLLGAAPHQSLVEDVFAHTHGNAYLNRLVVHDLTATARHLPPDLPGDLKSAVLESWRSLTSAARELTRIVAVGGRPVHPRQLSDVTSRPVDAVLPLLHEAVDAGVLDQSARGGYWFHHPMIAELLQQSLDPDERVRWHAAFAAHYEKTVTDAAPTADGSTPVEPMVAVADHHYRAYHPAEAYRWALRASDAVGAVGGVSEMLRLLRRAVDLREQLGSAVEDRQELLLRLMQAACDAGAHEEELRAIHLLLDEVQRDAQPLLVAELLVRRAHLRFTVGHAFLSASDMRSAVAFASREPASWQHAFALAELAHAKIWQGDPGAPALADQALAGARTSGHPRALSYALTAKAMSALVGGDAEEAVGRATEAVDASVAARDYWAYFNAAVWEANALEIWASRTFADRLRLRREQLAALGAPHPYLAMLSAEEASSWLAVGDWRECLDRLRVALGSDPGPFADVSARLAAARLAALQGRPAEARGHLDRADEVFIASSGYPNFTFDAVRAEVCLAGGDPAGAVEAALAGANSPGMPPTMCEWLLPLAARGLADQVEAVRVVGGDPTPLLRAVDGLTARFPSVIRDFGLPTELWRRQVRALEGLYLAEVARAREDADNQGRWVAVIDDCHEGQLAWEEAYACWRAAQALLVRGHQRERAASVLRRGLALAEELEALPLQTELEELARTARIPFGRVDSGAPSERTNRSASSARLPGLTSRELEILDHVVAGRTYGEIARALVISEKTVSSHISNLLRKTGAANRVDLARLARARQGRPRGM
ncbi:helix-turn-helix transcriptional regulator [Cryobacterium tepidiphilum]|uniref:HTH luxR-type domain-containing protein n=1 Tax=Cryobacterium tepidiphilum TaxID=2486026 RepID=A0A3M8LRX2_9MICO|nr:AAA family ATPase [Cryobacterium tepidiphilum]RNE67238.1 hypothetical protein EEJ31_00165 [Cryobacterium tepidiphilum]